MAGEKTNKAPQARPTSLPYYASLDGLRGGALVAMLFYHSTVNPVPGGFLSISTFFTLSGFLITSLLLYERDRSGGVDLGDFWRRRFRRLMPGAVVALALIALASPWIADAGQLASLRGDGLAALFYVGNWRFISLGSEYAHLFASPSLVQHFWSLSIEEQFYLSYPLVFISLMRSGGRRAFATALALLAAASTLWMLWLYEPTASTSRLYFGTDTRAAEILLGALLAVWHAGRGPLGPRGARLAGAAGVVGLLGTAFFWLAVPMETGWLWQGGFLLYAALTSAAILGCVQPSGPTRALLSLQPLPWLGRVSYGVYIYHFPVYLALDPQLTGLAPWPLLALRVGVTFLLAVPSFYLLELPIRRGRIRAPVAQVAVAVGGVALAVLAMVVATPDPAARQGRAEQPSLSNEAGAGLRIMVVGDSIAHRIRYGLERWSRDEDAAVFDATMTGCGVGRGGRLPDMFKERGDECDDWPERWRDQLEEFEPDVVVMLVASWDMRDRQLPGWSEPRLIGDPVFDAWLRSEMLTAARVLSSTGARVLWLESPCIVPRFGPVQGPFEPWRTERFNVLLHQSVGRTAGDLVEVVEFHDVVCPGGEFTNEIDGVGDFRPDGSHFSPGGADWVAAWLAPRLRASDR